MAEAAFTRRQNLNPIRTDHRETVAAGTAAEKVGEEVPPVYDALGGGETEANDLHLAVCPDAEHPQNRTPERARARIAGTHHTVEHQRVMADLHGPVSGAPCKVITPYARTPLSGERVAALGSAVRSNGPRSACCSAVRCGSGILRRIAPASFPGSDGANHNGCDRGCPASAVPVALRPQLRRSVNPAPDARMYARGSSGTCPPFRPATP